MNRPRVLHLIHHLRVGGAERLLVELLPRLSQAGFEVHVGCLDDRGSLFEELQRQGIPAHFIGRKRGLDPLAVRRLARLLRELRIDLLNTHSFSAGFWGRLAAILARTPYVVTTIHTVAGWSQPGKQRWGNRLLLPATDRVVAVSESVRRSLVSQGMPAGLITVIHNGICMGRFNRAGNQQEARKAMGLPSDAFLVGMVGRCSPEKGGPLFIHALSRLLSEGRPVYGVLVGDGPDRAAWQALAVQAGVADRTRFVGTQVDIAPWLAVLDVLVCPSIQESFGIAALEAQAAGIPVVATRVDGFLEVLHHGEDALLVEPGNSASLAGAIRTVLDAPGLADKLSLGGRRNASRFTIENTAQQYAALYRDLRGRR